MPCLCRHWVEKKISRSGCHLGFHLFLVAVVLLSLHTSQSLIGQNHEQDTVSVIEKMVNKSDSLVHNRNPSKPSENGSQSPITSPENPFLLQNRSRLNRELNNLLLKLYVIHPENKKTPVTDANLTAFDGMIIRNIEIKKVNIFAGSTMDTGYVPNNWIQKVGTAVHTGTREKNIRRNLLLHSGDRLDVFQAAENERLIRELPYIMDARFLVKPIPGESDSVDLVLLTKDLLPFGFSMELSRANAGNAGLGYYNIFGYGHQFLTTAYWDGKHSPLIGYRLLYGIPNISGTYISSELEFINRWNTKTGRFKVARDFKTVGFKNAGAIEIENSDLIRDVVLIDSTIKDEALRYTNYDFWVGRMFNLKMNNPAGISSSLFLSGRVFINHNILGPATKEHIFYAFQDKTQLLFSGGYTHRGFRKDNMIYTFNRVEDVPYGYILEFLSGVEWGQYKTRPYLAASASFGKYLRHNGYVFGRIEYGTFINGNSFEQSALRLQFKSFTRLHTLGVFQYRNFATINYLNGINRYKDEFTSLENNGGISGLLSPSLRGNEKLTLNLESVVFTPYRLLGFRFAFVGSLDLGLIKTENLRYFESTPYSGFGIGLIIRNENWVFDTFELKFSVYPGIPADARPTYIEVGTLPRLKTSALFPEKPDLIEYK